MAKEFDGIHEKLKRANENIRNLDSEIVTFIEGGKYAVLPDANDDEAVAYHKNRIIPPRFGVLVGEIIHHFRSCLGYPLLLQKPRKHRRSYRASDVVVAFGPIHAFASEGTAQSEQRAHINADRAQEAFAVVGQQELRSRAAEAGDEDFGRG